MLCVPEPAYGRDYAAGDVFFTTSTGSAIGGGFLAHNIAMETAPEEWLGNLLVATHCGVVAEDGRGVEALTAGVRETSLEHYLTDREALFWVRTPPGQTALAAAKLVALAREVAKAAPGYDYRLLFGMGIVGNEPGPEAHPWDTRDAMICSEFVVVLLHQIAHLLEQPLPPGLAACHPSRATPHWLNRQLKGS